MTAPRPLWHDLYDPDGCCAFDLFQAVRLLQMLGRDRDPAGRWPDVEDATRFRSHLSLAFPPSALAQIIPPAGHAGSRDPDPRREPAAVRIRSRYPRVAVPVTVVSLFGLTGPTGPLPTVYTEYLLDLSRGYNPRTGDRITRPQYRTLLRDWLDIFNHRLTALYYRAWEKYRFPAAFFRYATDAAADRPAPPDQFTAVLFSLSGLGVPGLRDRVRVLPPPAADPAGDPPAPLARVNDLALLHYAAALAKRRPTAGELAVLLEDYFGVRVAVESFTGQWLDLNPADLTMFPDAAQPERGGRLGVNAVAGERVWDAGSKFRVRLGPLHRAEFEEFLPDPTPVRARKAGFLLAQLVRLYVGAEFDFEVQLVLYGPEVPPCRLDDPGPDDLGARLGWNTWLPADPPPAEVADVTYDGVCEDTLAAL